MPPLIQFDRVTYRHPGSSETTPPALNDITLTINRGEWVALLGANGSGKTTLARHCNALVLPTTGKVLIDGKDTSTVKLLPQIRSQVGMVFQNPEDQMVATLIQEDTAFGPENLGIPSAEIRARVTTSLDTVEMSQHAHRPPHLLSAGQMQRVALAGVLAMQPECIIFDESTAMLDPRGRMEVMDQMRQLHDKGFTVIFITHFMEEAARADRVVVLNNGMLSFDGSPADLFADIPLLTRCGLEQPLTLQIMIAIRKLNPALAHLSDNFEQAVRDVPLFSGEFYVAEPARRSNGAEALISIEHLNHTYLPNTPLAQRALEDVSLTVTAGKAHGFVGATGSGKSTLLQHLNGLYRPQSGTIRVGPYNFSDDALDVKALRRFAGLVFQNPEIYFFEQYVGDEIAYGPKLLYGRDGLKERVKNAMALVGLDFETFKDRITFTLSGGEKRKVALAATLAIQPRLLILDEPTAGLDPVSRHNLHATLKKFKANGIDLILSSHSMGDITQLTQNMTIMSGGCSLRTGNTAALFNDAELINQASLGQPAVVRLASAFRAKGWPVPVSTMSNGQLLAALRKCSGASAHE
ncbi:MAG: energy-coupling factor transporter ATPase [Chloroflexi bacterium HGW-Chloroflexi-5]|jgi:energy-coupling factor transport system ATP-binding protein|nr:MAG: energy-coupling factor transporter ATPase [Chloroflexi bacterium HGW-Chloroflexi-5]